MAITKQFLSSQLLVLNEGTYSSRIDVVFDVYHESSIKDAERGNRGATNPTIQHKKITGGHTIQHWRKLLCSPGNKTSLVKFLIDEWKMPVHRKRLGSKML